MQIVVNLAIVAGILVHIIKAVTCPYGHVGSYLANRLRRLDRCSSAGRWHFCLSAYLCPLAKPMINQKQRSKDADALYAFKSRGFSGEIRVNIQFTVKLRSLSS